MPCHCDISHLLPTLLLLVLSSQSPPPAVSPRGVRIVGGYQCDLFMHPFFVSLYYNNILCGGSLLTTKWILTAAHCVSTFTSGKEMVAKALYSRTSELLQSRKVLQVVVHPSFDLVKQMSGKELRFDIAVVQTSRPFETTRYLGFATLPKRNNGVLCQNGLVMGIGTTFKEMYSDGREHTNFHFKCVELPFIDSELCSRTWPGSVIDNSVLCTMEVRGGQDACSGDSGGPVVCEEVVIGIVSAGKGCALPNHSGVHTKVENYLDFIEKSIKLTLSAGERVCLKWIFLYLNLYLSLTMS